MLIRQLVNTGVTSKELKTNSVCLVAAIAIVEIKGGFVVKYGSRTRATKGA